MKSRLERITVGIVVTIGSLAAPTRAAVVETAEPFVGVKHVRLVERLDPSTEGPIQLPRPVVVNVIQIDPEATGVRFLLQPGNGEKPGEVTRSTTRRFVDQASAQVGINADFYDVKPPYTQAPPEYYTDVVHVAVSDGEAYSLPSRAGQPIFNISQQNVARVLTAVDADSLETVEGETLYNALGGNQRLVTQGVNTTPPNARYTKALNPHTAIGVSKAGHILFMVVDGRQGDFSGGMRTDEMADLLIEMFDCRDAINLDGGGSSTMVMDDTDDGQANARLVNSPSDHATAIAAGNERMVSNSLAVFARHRSGYEPLAAVPRPEVPPSQPLITERAVFDDFEDGPGHFSAASLASGSNRNVAADATLEIDPTHAVSKKASMKVTFATAGDNRNAMLLRLLSAGASPVNNLYGPSENQAMGTEGVIGFAARLEPGSAPLFAGVILDDGHLNTDAHERSTPIELKADGRWHLYQWALQDASQWQNFTRGNGRLDGPNTYVDALYFTTSDGDQAEPRAWRGSVWIDYLALSPNGRLTLPRR